MASQHKEGSGSWSSASFRRMLLTESIASVFSRQEEPLASSPDDFETGSEQETISIDATEHKIIDSKHVLKEMKSDTITPASHDASQGPMLQEKRSSHGSGNTVQSNEITNIAADPMSNHTDGGINYRSLSWWQAGMLMIAETISLGILSLPKALSTLGLIPGLILLIGLGGLASYTGYVIGQFKLQHPEVHSMGDAGYILFGRVGREVLGAGQLIFIIFIMGSHILTFSIMMNAITDHASCTIIFMLVGMIVSLFFTFPRTLRGLTWLCITSFISIIAAVGTTMIGVSISRPGLQYSHHDNRHGYLSVNLWPQADITFHTAFLAMANIVFAYAGHVAFFSFISECRRPRDFPKALALLQCSDITMYLISSVVIFYYTGDKVASPALDSAGPMVRKIAYGLAIPTIVIAGVVNGHVAAKYVFVRLLRPDGWLSAWSTDKNRKPGEKSFGRDDSGQDLLHSKGAKAWSIWIAIVSVLWVVAWIISEGVPVFNDLLGLTSALFASWFTFGLSGMFFIHMNVQRQGWRLGWKEHVKPTLAKWVLLLVNLLCVLVGATICVAGLYSSGRSIAEHAEEGMSFGCADNSQS